MTPALTQVGIDAESFKAELDAKQQAKLQRLYGGRAASAAPPVAVVAAAAAGASPGAAWVPSGSGSAAGVAGGAASAATEAEEWEERQRRHEDAHLGRFERVMPADDPGVQALHEDLLNGAREVFYAHTTQVRHRCRLPHHALL